jgi:hypothetical protein
MELFRGVKSEPKNKGKGGPITTLKKTKIIDVIQDLIKTRQIKDIEYQDLAKQYNTTRQTISKYVDEVYASIPPEEVNKVLVDFKFTFQRLEDEVNSALEEADTIKEKLEVIRTYFQLIREKTDYLERFFIKQKAEENINVSGQILHKQIIINIPAEVTKLLENGNRTS